VARLVQDKRRERGLQEAGTQLRTVYPEPHGTHPKAQFLVTDLEKAKNSVKLPRMKWVKLSLSLAVFVPGCPLLGAFSTLDSGFPL
jgi:hypothetical protein